MRSAQDIAISKTPLEMVTLRKATSIMQAAKWGMAESHTQLKDAAYSSVKTMEKENIMKLVPSLCDPRLVGGGFNEIANPHAHN